MAESDERGKRIITISASFGAGGSVVGPAVASRLGLPFLDRALPLAVARTLNVPAEEAIARDERPPSLMQRILKSMAGAVVPWGVAPPPVDAVTTEDSFRTATEQVLKELATTSGGVVLGRAGAVVLAGEPAALHVRLDGAKAVRVERVLETESGDRDAATKLVEDTDRAWESYVRYFYNVDPHEPGLYHLLIDTTVIPLETCTDIIVLAATATAPA